MIKAYTKKDCKWMNLVVFGAKTFSTCSKRQYMAIILDQRGKVLGLGYNGGPPGYEHCSDGGCPRLFEDSSSGSNYDNCIAVHAEANAILHSDWSQRIGSSIYVNGPPCFSCAKLIVLSGIKKVFYLGDPNYLDFPNVKKFLNDNKVQVIKINKKDL